MRLHPPFTFALVCLGLLVLFADAWLTPASATDARQAMTMCDRNPKCGYRVNDNGSVDLQVQNCGGGSETCFINCPQKGQCTCDLCGTPARVGGGKGKGMRATVSGVLAVSRSSGQGANSTRPPSGGLLEGGLGLSTQGPAATGSPAARGAAPAAPAGQLR